MIMGRRARSCTWAWDLEKHTARWCRSGRFRPVPLFFSTRAMQERSSRGHVRGQEEIERCSSTRDDRLIDSCQICQLQMLEFQAQGFCPRPDFPGLTPDFPVGQIFRPVGRIFRPVVCSIKIAAEKFVLQGG